MDTELAGRTAVVGGATSGLGLAIAQLSEGANVVLVGRFAAVVTFLASAAAPCGAQIRRDGGLARTH